MPFVAQPYHKKQFTITAPAIQQTLREEEQNDISYKNKDKTNQSQSFMKKGDRNYKQKGDRKWQVWLVSRVQGFPYWEGRGQSTPIKEKFGYPLLSTMKNSLQ